MSCYSDKVPGKQGEQIITEPEENISTLENVPKVESCGALSLIPKVETRGVIHFLPKSENEREAFEVFCRYGGMQNFVLNLLKEKDIHAALPVGNVCINLQLCRHEGHLVSKGAYQPKRDIVPARCEVVDDPQLIRENLFLQYSTLLEESEPKHLRKTFIERGIISKSFFEELVKLPRRVAMDRFLRKVLDIGSKEALHALVDALKVGGEEALAEKLVTKMSFFGGTDHVDDTLVKVVKVVLQTHAVEDVVWSCHLEVMIGKEGTEDPREPTE